MAGSGIYALDVVVPEGPRSNPHRATPHRTTSLYGHSLFEKPVFARQFVVREASPCAATRCSRSISSYGNSLIEKPTLVRQPVVREVGPVRKLIVHRRVLLEDAQQTSRQDVNLKSQALLSRMVEEGLFHGLRMMADLTIPPKTPTMNFSGSSKKGIRGKPRCKNKS